MHAEMARWIENVTEPDLAAELSRMKEAAETGDESAFTDAFFQDLSFGTAGLRGTLGAGTNRMNIYTVGRATQGFADYLNAHFENPSVAIARDSRNNGELFVRTAAAIFAANGVHAYVYPRISPVPTLSWAVRDLGCSGGVCVTASHNPAAYNGYKAYGPDGCQITSEAAAAISAAIESTDIFSGVKSVDFDAALAKGDVTWIDDAVLERYYDAVLSKSVSNLSADEVAKAPLKLVYSPLNGTGLVPVTTVLERAGVTDITVVPEQRDPDGDFPTCPYPNPEIREAMQKDIELCERVHPDLLLATDPDADRVGVAVKDGEDYLLLTGNEMGVLLLDYICCMRAERDENLAEKVAVTTIVSSAMVEALAAKYGFELRRCLTGFKYIGDIITELADAGQADRFIFGFEESYGYLSGDHVRDKDAVKREPAHLPDGAELQAAGKKPRGRDARPVRRARVLAQPHRVSIVSRRRGGCRDGSNHGALASGGAKRGCRPRRRERRRLQRRGNGASTRERRRSSAWRAATRPSCARAAPSPKSSSTCSRKTTREKAPRHCSIASRQRAENCLRKAAAGKARPQAARIVPKRGKRGAANCVAAALCGDREQAARTRPKRRRDAGFLSLEHVCRKGCCPCDHFASGTPSRSLPSAHLAENEAVVDNNQRYVRSFLLLTFFQQFRPGQT